MTVTAPLSRNNPLAGFMRQPKIYLPLPSKGKFWAPKSLDLPENGELPVYSMTAKDELMFKTPDALLNGQAIVDVIQSCIPGIKNAWATPIMDLDAILIAIRIATYGETMTFSTKVPVVDEEVDFEVDLKIFLDQQQNNTWDEVVVINEDLEIYVKPLTYKHMTQVGIKSFETQRILNLVNDQTISDEKKVELFNASFANLTQITVDLLAESVYRIVAGGTEVTDLRFIKEYLSNADKDIFEQIKNHLDQLKTHNEVKPLELGTTPEQQAAGAPVKFDVPINFNNADFFG